ncbi:uncharacterized protein LOC112493792 isoform X3 [Cephus cinctus]|uniref:Uncharacterized protein LOC112493792 isoform X3 n=1 Tax=Cephus cinctus TaxID=211228 RepID=A0AAJ7RA93_CEPCN|nr:uncharacterized protein LOC112493792 isoform X3 [Cephus cinctus]
MLKKTGIERDIFGLNAGKEPKEKDKKEKGNIKERPMSAALSVTQEAETPSVPLTTEAGDPVVVLIELELYTPLIQCRAKIDFTNALEEMITTTKVHDPYPYTIQLAEEQYLNSIRKLVDTITEGYRDFIEKNNTSQNQVDGSVMESCNETEIENSSSSKIFSEKSKSTQPESLKVFGSDFIATAYIYLTEQMHLAINKEVEGHVINKQHLESTNLINYCYYAEEADELNHIDDAKRYHRTVNN